ncbi:MAG: ribonuclease P protein component [Nitrosomonadales bacterium]|nr:ribonuclease P protein component [Nitrosomonadales bacterium]
MLSRHVAPRAVPDSRFSISALPSSLSAEFTAVHRLLRKNGFDHVIRAENIADKYFKIFFVRNGERNARLGIIVAKKTLSGAADRNRVKRIIREAFRQHNIKQCKLDVVVMARHAYPLESGAQAGNLKMLFSRVENRCAEL